MVKAKAKGKATITVSLKADKKVKATCIVTVKYPTVKTDVKKLTLKEGESYQLTVTTQPAGEIEYIPVDETIATVSPDGMITGIKKGSTKVMVWANDAVKVVKIKVTK